mgnify:CR=1 FL=1
MAVAIAALLVFLGTLACAGSATVTTSIATATPTPAPTAIETEPPATPTVAGRTPRPTPRPTVELGTTPIRTPGPVILVPTPTPTRTPRATPTATPIPTPTPTPPPEPTRTAVSLPTQAATPTPAATATPGGTPTPIPTPTPTPSLPPGKSLTINGTLVEPGEKTLTMAGGTVILSLAPRVDGTYTLDAYVSLIAHPGLTGSPVGWGGVDSQDGNLASLRMNADRFVALTMISPTPTPRPVVTVGGTISFAATWRSDNVYLVTSDVEVQTGVILTIEPGTLVKFDGAKLQIAGTLRAPGTSENPVTFTSDSSWEGIALLDSSVNSSISFGVIEKATGTALDINGGTLTLTNSTIRLSSQGIWVRSSRTTITGNDIYSNDTGLITGTTYNLDLRQNTIRNNDVGIRVVGPGGNLLFNGNNFMTNALHNILVVGSGDRSVNAAGNWWGTADRDAIERSIYHKNDDEFLSTVVFEPFAVELVAAAP